MTTEYEFPEPGCYQDGACHSATEMDVFVIELARAYGWDNTDPADAEDEFLNELANEAIEFLNSLETRDGYFWAFENGDFGLWTEEEP
jgi:hypothetical protein